MSGPAHDRPASRTYPLCRRNTTTDVSFLFAIAASVRIPAVVLPILLARLRTARLGYRHFVSPLSPRYRPCSPCGHAMRGTPCRYQDFRQTPSAARPQTRFRPWRKTAVTGVTRVTHVLRRHLHLKNTFHRRRRKARGAEHRPANPQPVHHRHGGD